jgi:D-inositol-3-phosphate glycosyltransferase
LLTLIRLNSARSSCDWAPFVPEIYGVPFKRFPYLFSSIFPTSDMNKRISPSPVTLLTGGTDRHYVCALAKAIATSGMAVDVVGNTEMNSCEMRGFANVRLLPLYAMQRPEWGVFRKLLSCIAVYMRIVCYAATSSSHTFHILWNYKLAFFDRTLLLLYYKFLGKKLVFTAHNVNAAERDGADSLLNRLTLSVQYRLVDHIFVHTKSMKDQLANSFGISLKKVTVIPFGVGDMVPNSSVTSTEAKQRLGLSESDLTILFFGRIAQYKGLDLLVDAFSRIASLDRNYRLMIVGHFSKESTEYWKEIQEMIESGPVREQIVQEIRFTADDEMEIYFKAADVLVLPYRQVFQSGVLFMSQSFGLPVIATDVGSFRDEIIEGTNGYVCRPDDPEKLAKSIEDYFSSELFRSLDERRASIQKLVRMSHSWDIVAKATRDVYARVSQHIPADHRTSSARINRVPSDQSDVAESLDS